MDGRGQAWSEGAPAAGTRPRYGGFGYARRQTPRHKFPADLREVTCYPDHSPARSPSIGKYRGRGGIACPCRRLTSPSGLGSGMTPPMITPARSTLARNCGGNTSRPQT
jgi:hypothetical protein